MIGQSIGRYQILEQVGEGGMATVYKALDTHLDRFVAIKIIRKEVFSPSILERVLQRFEREGKTLAKLTHSNIVHVYDYGEFNGSPYLIMQFVDGGTLKQYMGSALAWQDAVRFILPIAQALSYAHQHGVVHRDVKPSNILVASEGIPLLTDFGIAKLLENEDGQTLTNTGVGIGTPEYMAPEQCLGIKDIDGRADMYSLGIVLYELLTGHKPFMADTPMAIVIKQVHDPLPNPLTFNPGLPKTLTRFIQVALEKESANRFSDMTDFIRALEAVYSTPPQKDTGLIAQGSENILSYSSISSPITPVKPNTTIPTIDNIDTNPTKETEDDITPPKTGNAKRISKFNGQNKPKKKVSTWMILTILLFSAALIIIIILKAMSTPITNSFTINAAEEWQQISEQYYHAGDPFRITYESGSWGASWGTNSVPESSQNWSTRGQIISWTGIMALVCRVGSSYPFPINSGIAYTAEANGYISCRINDLDTNDNHGSVTFLLEVWN